MRSGYWLHGDWPHVGISSYVTQFWGFYDFPSAIHKSGPYNCKKIENLKTKNCRIFKKIRLSKNCLIQISWDTQICRIFTIKTVGFKKLEHLKL